VRATVVVEPDARPRCIDAVELLAAAPRDGGTERDALILTRDATIVREISADRRDPIDDAVERYVEALEAGVREKLTQPSLGALLRTEADLVIDAMTAWSDVALADGWRSYADEPCVVDVLEELIGAPNESSVAAPSD